MASSDDEIKQGCCALLYQAHRVTEGLMTQMDSALVDPIEPTQVKTLASTLALDLARHFYCEEHGLFPVLSLYRTMVLMHVEHEGLVDTQDAFLKAVSSEPFPALETLYPLWVAWRDRLKAHILEEEQGVFSLAQSVLEPEEKALVARKLQELTVYTQALEDLSVLLSASKTPEYRLQDKALWETATRPVVYEPLFQQDYAGLYHIYLAAGKALKPHWTAEAQCFIVVSGQVLFESPTHQETLMPGMVLEVEPRLKLSFQAVKDSHLIAMKLWPKPHFIRM